MTVPLALILLALGLVILLKGADWLVDGAVALAELFGVSPMIVGLTVVAMGTSAPEVAASITAALDNKGDMAIGNVYGSNIANLALVGGICAMIRPISVKLSVLKREMPAMIGVALLLFPLFYDKFLGRIDSAILLSVFVSMVVFTVISARRESKTSPAGNAIVDHQIQENIKHKLKSPLMAILFVFLGLAGLTIGAKLTVSSSVVIGQKIGLSEAVIGITIIAVGTSLPELMTCVNAALKGHDDISIGNLVGSNVFNTLLVIGAAGTFKPFNINHRFIGADFAILIAVSVVFVLIAVFKKKIGRFSGALLLSAYAGYMAYLFIYKPSE